MTEEEIKQEQDEQFNKLAKWSGMPMVTCDSYKIYKFVPMNGNKTALDMAMKFVGMKDGQPLREHHFLTLAGEVGRGKTHLALGIGWHFLENGMGMVKYWQVEKFMDELRDWYATSDMRMRDPTASKTSPYDKAAGCTLLILDDIGAEYSTPHTKAKLDELIDYRYIEKKLTVFTTNMHPDQLPPRLASRLLEGITVILEGPDFRKLIADKRKGGSQ